MKLMNIETCGMHWFNDSCACF